MGIKEFSGQTVSSQGLQINNSLSPAPLAMGEWPLWPRECNTKF